MSESRSWKLLLRAAIRYVLITINTLYANLSYVIWLTLLQPLTWWPNTEKLYWKIEGLLYQNNCSFFSFWTYNAGYHIVELGDDISGLLGEPCLLMVNHQSMADVPLLVSAFNSRHNLSNNLSWIIYAGFKHTNFGIICSGHKDFFIDVGKKKRDASLANLEIHLRDVYLPLKRHWLTIFPEGDFLLRCRSSSQDYAKKNGYPVLENCLLPRVAAVRTVLENARADSHTDGGDRLKYVIDLTIAYTDINNPMSFNTILNGLKPPCETVFHYRKYYIEEVPRDEEGISAWLFERYREKDQMLAEYYRTGVFPETPTQHPDHIKHPNTYRLKGYKIKECNWQYLINHSFCILSMTAFYWMCYSSYSYLVAKIYS
ncbi:unnamed protein product [Meganyctiphanes norvegica]|uniref:Phospholipid/glycerol acyltransferase domain-containing protein n=1 Tax=Meganyctiphanes norvegica TaxID=48144 RepID=A0AAV2S1S7_MEGNR